MHFFRNKHRDDFYYNKGYAIGEKIDQGALFKLNSLFNQYVSNSKHNSGEVYYSMFELNVEESLSLSNAIQEILNDFLISQFTSIRCFAAMFIVKNSDKIPLYLHRDWSYNLPNQGKVCTLWIPLVKCTKDNGALVVAPNSHLKEMGLYSGTYPSAKYSLNSIDNLTVLEAEAGESIFFNPSLLHGSMANNTKKERPVVVMLIFDKNTTPKYFHKLNDNLVEEYELTERLFFEQIGSLASGNKPSGILPVQTHSYTHTH